MLVLSRREQEQILIGPVTITVVAIEGTSRVRLGIEAPEDVVIRRAEVPEEDAE